MYHFFINKDNIETDTVRITGQDVNHIRNVLRLKNGEEILVSDGEGSDYSCVIDIIDEDKVICRIKGIAESGNEPSVEFYLFQGLPKADKFEHIIQKSVELGVHKIIPVETERSIVKYDEKKQQKKLERWQKIAEAAAKQSHRGIIPEVAEIISFSSAIRSSCDPAHISMAMDMVLIPYENYKDIKATKDLIRTIKPGMKVGIFIGPEGGFSDEEISLADECGARQISLGNRILRTETAPLMLLSVLMFSAEC